ncbi:uncharacterized protein LOC123702499 [Colias croceus]|uniref:uncharacterized protein LOC123702499 n=1 Tax=Colias crocea TaxID=72248 RepID=UPI001E2819A7|nr:uncharacterized protein LOC123702499 [Colias croceus]
MMFFKTTPTVLIFVTALMCIGLITGKSHKHADGPSCQNFSAGVNFKDEQAYGTWHLLHFKTELSKGSGEKHCVSFSALSKEERTDLEERIGKFVENLKWENMSLKMQIPCAEINSNKTRDYYLERLRDDGSYRTLQMPPPTAKLDLADFSRYPMRLKIIEGQYLGMMDCHEKFVFLMGKQPPTEKQIDDRLKKMIEAYWPEEN